VTRGAAAAVVVALAGAGCGGHHARTFPRTPGSAAGTSAGEPVTGAEVAVIRGWSVALQRGHVVAAARFFAVPVTVLNDPSGVVVLRTRGAVRRFNRDLPCGARLARWQRAPRHFVIATFRLTNRVGSRCDATPGALAAVAFLVRDGHIVQWLRVPVPAPAGSSNVT
jgi:hypothetical protein